jgi:hypothetical protein
MDRNVLKQFGIACVVLAAVLAILFAKSCSPDQTLFANDAPLGLLEADYGSMKTAWRGVWNDLNWLGISYPAALPHMTSGIWFLLGDNPVTFSKFLTPVSLLFLGLSVWVCLRQFGLRTSVCVIAAIAAMLNTNNLSHAAWGLPSRCTAMGSVFLAIAALRSSLNGRPICKALLAGLAVGLAIMEAFDVGAIYSLYVAAFGFFVVLAAGKADAPNIIRAVARIGIVAVFAAVCAAAALSTLIGTQVQGIAGMQQDAASKAARWDGATMWSLPKAETLRVLVPGLFGYRMDTEGGGNYWGSSGQQPGVPQSRHSGSGEYAGALVVIVAAFGIASAFRRKNNPYTIFERRIVWFFSGAALISLLLAWGRHAPFYQAIYALPFFSTIRNPMKFMHPFHLALVMLFGFGLEVIFRACAKEVESKAGGLKTALSQWWRRASPFERKWTFGSLGFCGLFLLGTFVYISSRSELLGYLRTGGFSAEVAEQIASFSYSEALWGWLYTTMAVLLVVVALSGWFSGRRTGYLALVFGLFLTLDLTMANLPWVKYYNYKERYAANPVIDFLRKDAHEHRATARLTPFAGKHLTVDDQGPAFTGFFAGIANQWLQHHFQYYNVQAIEPVQMPRTPDLDEKYYKALFPNQSMAVVPRLWELTNTRHLIGDKNFIAQLMQSLEPGRQRWRVAMSFDMTPKPGVPIESATLDDLTWVENPNGRFAIVEFTGALPRAKLYPAWQNITDDAAALRELTSATFDPRTNLLVQGEVGVTASGDTNFQGIATITSYKPKRIELAVSNSAPAVLLYNDKLEANWKLTVDGKPENFVRANFIMRGIPLGAGVHSVVMTYSTPMKGLYVSLAGFAMALAALGIVAFVPQKREEARRSSIPAS